MKLAVARKYLFGLAPFALALAPACAMTPPAQNSGSLASDGVQVAVVGQRCTETVEPDWPGANLVETTVEVQVGNTSPNPVTVNPEQLHLRGTDGRQVPSHGWEAGEAVSIESGQTKAFKVHFMARGGLSCTKPMQLDAESGVTVGSKPVRIGSVTFVPSRA